MPLLSAMLNMIYILLLSATWLNQALASIQIGPTTMSTMRTLRSVLEKQELGSGDDILISLLPISIWCVRFQTGSVACSSSVYVDIEVLPFRLGPIRFADWWAVLCGVEACNTR